MAHSTEDLIRNLSRDLPPVTPLRRLREVVLIALGISLPFDAYRLASAGINDSVAGTHPPSLVFLLVFAILILISIGGLLAGLASTIPGRQKAERLGTGLFLAAFAIAAAVLGSSLMVDSGRFVEGARSGASCAIGAAMLAIPAALIVAHFVLSGAAVRVSSALALATAGGMGVAGAVVHVTCPHPEPLHLVIGHGLAPFAGGLLILVCASVVLATRRWQAPE